MGLPAHLVRRADGKPIPNLNIPVIPKLEEVKEVPPPQPPTVESKIVHLPAAPTPAPTGGVRGFPYSEAHARTGNCSERFFGQRGFWSMFSEFME